MGKPANKKFFESYILENNGFVVTVRNGGKTMQGKIMDQHGTRLFSVRHGDGHISDFVLVGSDQLNDGQMCIQRGTDFVVKVSGQKFNLHTGERVLLVPSESDSELKGGVATHKKEVVVKPVAVETPVVEEVVAVETPVVEEEEVVIAEEPAQEEIEEDSELEESSTSRKKSRK